MTRVIGDISLSLDGYVTGPDPGPEQGLGRGGEALHDWAISSTEDVDRRILDESTTASGAVIMGRRLFDFIDGPTGWNDEMGYGADNAARPPFFVVSHSRPQQVRLALDFTFVTDIAAAVAQAKQAAGEKDVVIMGGAEVIRQAVVSGLADTLRLHVAPVVLGGGTALFAPGERAHLRVTETVWSPHAVHVTLVRS